MNIQDLLDAKLLDEMIELGFVRQQNHPDFPLRILNYTAQAQYEGEWNQVTKQCRGIIYNTETGEVVARPFSKFHNYAEHAEPKDPEKLSILPLDTPVEVTDKMDGSLGILYKYRSEPSVHPNYIATRGSFTSDQALWGSEQLRRRVTKLENIGEVTYLFELIFNENRIVVDYPFEDIVLLGAIEIETGAVISASDIKWNGRKAEQFQTPTLADALLLEPRPNSEGVVVRFLADDLMIKIKQEDYVQLHRIMTGLNARNVWELVAAQQCQHLIKGRAQWGSLLGFGWERAEECLAIADDWLEGVPDEFHDWVRSTTDDLLREHEQRYTAAVAEAVGIRSRYPTDRRAQYEAAAHNPYVKEIIAVVREHNLEPLFLKVWRDLEPAATAPFTRSEDVS